jgi:glyoxylase-like metal-dependent hydrolase (beta-lactamase superfamily II)
MPERHADNAAGNWYIDTRCIDCSAARTAAPGLIVARGGQSVFVRQPETAEEQMMAWRARLLCPTASVRTETRQDTPAGVFPEKMTEAVYRLGYNARSSYGAHSFLVRRTGGNVMVDSPRWAKQVVASLEEWGGLTDILLTHKDDVADADRYAEHFGARVTIHEADRAAAPYANNVLTGRDPIKLNDDLLVIPVPGHTEGSLVYLWDQRCLFTGDSLAWNFANDDLGAFRDFCWYSWQEQTRSLARLLDYSFEWVFAGHGGSQGMTAPEMRSRLASLLERMAAG